MSQFILFDGKIGSSPTMGIFRSRSSFCAIFNGSVSPAMSTVTGAFILGNAMCDKNRMEWMGMD